jgi:hypothetical protein
MATTFTALTNNVSGSTVTSYDTASINPASGSTIFLCFSFRSSDLASMASETETVTGCATTWTQLQRRNYDSSDRMIACLYRGVGPFTNAAVTLSTVSARSLGRGVWAVIQVAPDGTLTVVQSSQGYKTASGTTLSATLSAFANASNPTVLFGITDAGAATSWTPEAGWETALIATTNANGSVFAGHKTTEDTTPSVTMGAVVETVAFAMELQDAVAGPTITVQPVADVGIISNGQSTVYTGTATGTTISAFTWEVDGSPIADGGVYDIVTTGIGTGSASSTLTITRTDKTGTPFDINFDVTDANGTTASNTVTDTWWTGPVVTTFPATDGDGESTATLTSDFITEDNPGTAIEVRIPLADGDVTVTVTTTAS